MNAFLDLGTVAGKRCDTPVAGTRNANWLPPSYELKSELARFGLVASAHQDPNRTVAWVNSVCALFLLVGILGSRPASIRIKQLPPLDEVNAAIVEPLPPPPEVQSDQQEQEPQDEQEQPDTPQVVVVTPEAPFDQLLGPNHRQPTGAKSHCDSPTGGAPEATGGSPA